MSPYADPVLMMEQTGKDIVVSFKPNSNYLGSTPWEKDLLLAELKRVCALARKYGCNLEIIMKTIITLDDDPQRLWEWCEMATDVAENY